MNSENPHSGSQRDPLTAIRGVNYGSIAPEQARTLLKTYARTVNLIVSSLRTLPCSMGPDDLQTYGQMAVLEAYITHDPAHGLEKTWVTHVVRWRVQEAAKMAQRPEVPTDQAHTWANGAGPEEKTTVHEQKLWLESKIGSLSPREANVIALRLRGESSSAIAVTLGVSRGRISQNVSSAVQTLHKLALSEGLGLEEP